MTAEKQKIIRAAGIMAILGGIINIVSDQLLYNGPVSGRELDLLFMATNIPYSRILTGAILGAGLGIPLWFFILIPMYYAIKPAGKWFSYPVVIFFGHLVILSALYHGSGALLGACYYLSVNAGIDSAAVVSEMMDKVKAYEAAIFVIYPISMGLSSILLIFAVFFKKTLYKRWMVLCTPIISMPVIFTISNQLPAPIGGYFAPMDGSLMFTVFFILTTSVTWNYNNHT